MSLYRKNRGKIQVKVVTTTETVELYVVYLHPFLTFGFRAGKLVAYVTQCPQPLFCVSDNIMKGATTAATKEAVAETSTIPSVRTACLGPLRGPR